MLMPNNEILGPSRVIPRGIIRGVTPRTVCAIDVPGSRPNSPWGMDPGVIGPKGFLGPIS